MEIEAENTDQQDEQQEIDSQAEQSQGGTPDDQQQGNEEAASSEAQAEEVIVSIGDESPPSEEEEAKQAPQWLKELRKSNREKDKRIRELEALAAQRESASKPGQLSKPSLSDPDIDFDEEKYERKFEAWQKQEQDRRAEQQRQEAERTAQENAWKARLAAYDEGKAALKLSDFEDAEGIAREALDQTQLGIIVHGAKNPALITYALGKNPAKLKELASIKDPIQFTFAVANLENQVKTTTRKATPPAAEAPVRGNTPASLGADSELARLEAEAERTGDRTKVVAYRRQKLKAANQ